MTQKKVNAQACKKTSDLYLEREALGILLFDRAFNPSSVKDEFFTDANHRKILGVMHALASEGKDWGLPDVMARIEDSDCVRALSNTYLSSAEYPRIIANLEELMLKRRAIDLADGLKSGRIDFAEFLNDTKAIDLQIRQPKRISQVFSEYTAFIDEHAENGLPVFKTGFRFIDDIQGGVFPGDMGTIAGRPGKGKTTVMTNMAFNMASLGIRVQFISLEMPGLKILHKILARKLQLNSMHFRMPQNLTDDEIAEILKAGSELENLPFFIDSDCGNDIGIIESLVQTASPSVVFIDYLGLIYTTDGNNTAEKIGMIMKRLKALARKKQCVVVVAAQINREGDRELAENKIPSLRNLKSSGSIEEDSDFVIMLNTKKRTDEEYRRGDPARMELWLAKNRDGNCADNIQMEFDLETQTIKEL